MTGMMNPQLNAATPEGGARTLVASYKSYADAQRAVDYLSDQKFPVENIAIVAEGLKLVEQVTGRLDWGRALGNGLVSGAITGLFVGLLFSLFSLSSAALVSLLLYGLIVGAIIGAIWSLIFYGLSGGRRDFSSVGGMQADTYNVMSTAAHAPEAQRLIAQMPMR